MQIVDEAASPKDIVLEHLKRLQELDLRIAPGVRKRAAPQMLARIYRSGRSAVREMQDFIDEH
eukprot:10700320-Lingulodinium_polyedra.AAC.1